MTQRMISRWGRRVFFGVPHHCGGGVYGCGGDASLVLCTRPSEELYRRADALSFVVEITAKGRDFFYKEHYPSMRLVEENGRYYIHGFYNVGEEEFIADYFIHYGDAVQTVEPLALRDVIRTRLHTLTVHYKEMA